MERDVEEMATEPARLLLFSQFRPVWTRTTVTNKSVLTIDSAENSHPVMGSCSASVVFLSIAALLTLAHVDKNNRVEQDYPCH